MDKQYDRPVISCRPCSYGVLCCTVVLRSVGIHIFNQLAPFVKLPFSALMLLVRCQEGHPAHKNLTDKVLA